MKKLDLLQRQSSFRDDGTGGWKTFLSSEGPPAQVLKINPTIHLLLSRRSMPLSNWWVVVLFCFFYRGESLEPGEDIISRHLCIVFNGPVTSFHGPVPPGHTRPVWTGSHQTATTVRNTGDWVSFLFFLFLPVLQRPEWGGILKGSDDPVCTGF